MITLLPDFEEKERKFWKYIEDYLRYPDIIKTYKPLKLIRLKNFIENQMASRKSQIILYLGELSQKECLNSFDIDIKSRLGEIKLSQQLTMYKNYLSDSDIIIIEKEIINLLKTTNQYCCNFFTLENIHKSISIILNDYFEEKNIQSKQTPEEASSVTEIKDIKYTAKYLKQNGKRYSLAQISLFIIYKNYKTNLHDPRLTDKTVFHKLALDFGFNSPTSAYQIFQEWHKRKDNSTQRLGHKGPENVKLDIEAILQLLDPEEQIQAKKDIESLDLQIN
jgi:hypothetical protein